jgi:hypothetical protein
MLVVAGTGPLTNAAVPVPKTPGTALTETPLAVPWPTFATFTTTVITAPVPTSAGDACTDCTDSCDRAWMFNTLLALDAEAIAAPLYWSYPEALPANVAVPDPAAEYVHVKLADAPPVMYRNPPATVTGTNPPVPEGVKLEAVTVTAAASDAVPPLATVITTVTTWPWFTCAGLITIDDVNAAFRTTLLCALVFDVATASSPVFASTPCAET